MEPEAALAQRLASNEKPIRTKALKTLRKYINLRSQKTEGGFMSDDLLKIWKGLFYCLWMQDKPFLQEELSDRISGLIHSFHTTDSQLLYFETFLQTLKREWNGIDKLRMDKFFQLVRFMFRQTFEVLKRKEWESSLVNQFLEVFSTQLLQSTVHVPDGLILHILDLYMTELARVGSAELTAKQNLTFIHPFCKTMAKSKHQSLVVSISKNIFSTIVDHASFAVEDLMKELSQAGEDSDSGQASEEEEESAEEDEPKSKTFKRAKMTKTNGIPRADDDSEDMDDAEPLDMDDVAPEEDIGSVLQFDYGAVADHLFELASRANIPNFNRVKVYRLVKIFRDLSEGIFPQDEEAVVKPKKKTKSNKKKKSKKKRRNEYHDDEESPAKKSKPCKDMQNELDQEDAVPSDTTLSENVNKKKKKKGKEKCEEEQTGELAEAGTDAGTSTGTSQATVESALEENEACSQSEMESSTRKKRRKSKKMKSTEESNEFTNETLINTPEVEPLVEQQPEGEVLKKKKKKAKKAVVEDKKETEDDVLIFDPEQSLGKDQTVATIIIDATEEQQSEGIVSTMKKKRNKKQKQKQLTVENSSSEHVEVKEPELVSDRHTDTEIIEISESKHLKKKQKKKAKQASLESEVEAACTNQILEIKDSSCAPTPLKKKKTQKKQKKQLVDLTADDGEEYQPVEATEVPVQEKKKKKQKQKAEAETPRNDSSTPLIKGKKKRKIQSEEAETCINGETVKEDVKIPLSPTPKKKLKLKKPSSETKFASFQGKTKTPTPLFCKVKPKGSPSTPLSGLKARFQGKLSVTPRTLCKTFQTPKSETKKVTFGLKNNKTTEFKKTDRSLLVSPVGSSRVAFDPKKKPTSSVLKSPMASPSVSLKKLTPKKRPTAADFF